MPYQVLIKRSGEKELDSLPANLKNRITERLVVHQHESAVRNRDFAQDLLEDSRRAGTQEFHVAALGQVM